MPVGKRCGAFTLIELLVTIAVIVIAATVAIPSFQGMIARNRLSTDFNQILAVVNFAKSEAVKRRSDITVAVSGEGGSWEAEIWIGREDDIVVDGCSSSLSCLRSVSEPTSPVEIVDINITFNALGRAILTCEINNPCSVAMTHPRLGEDEKQTILINSLGNIYREDD